MLRGIYAEGFVRLGLIMMHADIDMSVFHPRGDGCMQLFANQIQSIQRVVVAVLQDHIQNFRRSVQQPAFCYRLLDS